MWGRLRFGLPSGIRFFSFFHTRYNLNITLTELRINLVFLYLERFSNECRKNQNQSNFPTQSQQTQITQWTNQNLKQIHVTGTKRGKTRASKSGLVWVLLLIGRESGASFLNPANNRAKWSKTKAKRELLSTVNWKLLYHHTVHFWHCWSEQYAGRTDVTMNLVNIT